MITSSNFKDYTLLAAGDKEKLEYTKKRIKEIYKVNYSKANCRGMPKGRKAI